MPAVGDQHKLNGNNTSNPFEEQKPRIAEYTAQEIATLQSRLDRQLGPEFISTRAGPGGSRVHYLAADKAISLANEVFGFNGWSSSIQNIQIDFVDENLQTGKISLGLSVIVRVTLKDGTHHEDIGYGQIENCKGKAAAFEKAKKEGTTDALKRALRNFGNVLGNCVYDKNYLAKITKVKVGATKWDPEMLHRHPDFAPKKQEEEMKSNGPAPAQEAPNEFDDTFDLADFEEVDFDGVDMEHPEEVALPAEPAESNGGPANGAPERMLPPARPDLTTPSKAPVVSGPAPRPASTRSGPSNGSLNIIPQPLPGHRLPAPMAPAPKPTTGTDETSRPSSPAGGPQHLAPHPPGQGPSGAAGFPRPAGFYSARAAGNIDAHNNVITSGPATAPKFNPHAESPSIRKTTGVNHNKSVPLKRDLTVDIPKLPAPNVVHPQSDQSRRVGAPGPNGPFSTGRGPNTSAYRPPTRRGPDSIAGPTTNPAEPECFDRDLSAAKRTPLGDVSNVQHNVTAVTADGLDAKRQRVSETAINGNEATKNTNQSNG
ncbi:uncharacterized protein Z518_04492 [Rhinocladiella mackenziei CBS 650.93]|uniref:RAD52 homolog n=1 Tax=Rhinocladiella mackenziei CBS 650.93 TaxID=1442369 RepID=A0A0D2ITP7_9EURO|nr:uncharacterized protein Z518_04492 [Rhinocladiella mackenziei CBS 650.93]KIX06516.1 hypothetical protein Z518_04492 [Rhinocladiella mackenziei CBS 650.93]